MLRSPTAAFVLTKRYGLNTRSCGVDTESALIPVDRILLTWSEEIVCFEHSHQYAIEMLLDKFKLKRRIVNLQIPDEYEYMQEELINLIEVTYR